LFGTNKLACPTSTLGCGDVPWRDGFWSLPPRPKSSLEDPCSLLLDQNTPSLPLVPGHGAISSRCYASKQQKREASQFSIVPEQPAGVVKFMGNSSFMMRACDIQPLPYKMIQILLLKASEHRSDTKQNSRDTNTPSSPGNDSGA
jgi:hypothetical protein